MYRGLDDCLSVYGFDFIFSPDFNYLHDIDETPLFGFKFKYDVYIHYEPYHLQFINRIPCVLDVSLDLNIYQAIDINYSLNYTTFKYFNHFTYNMLYSYCGENFIDFSVLFDLIKNDFKYKYVLFSSQYPKYPGIIRKFF